ncbi:hypothetical protein PFISCL1PPCAC_21172, partial [Pristionchus fissidentatus]
YFREDLRLSDDVIPTGYDIELSVNIRDHAGATRSNFNGNSTIRLDVARPTDKIELHSNGLVIHEAAIMRWQDGKSPVTVTKVSTDLKRETITLHLNKTVQPTKEFYIKVSY